MVLNMVGIPENVLPNVNDVEVATSHQNNNKLVIIRKEY